jgi:hypothetical protein
MKKIILTIIGLMFSSVQVFALEDSSFTGANLVAELNKIMSQYETQLKSLQAENSLLRNEVSKAGIKIPLSEFPWAIIASETGSTTGTSSGKTATGKTLVQKKVTTKTAQDTVSWELNAALDTIEKEHWPQYRGFIGKILPDWSAIKNAYKLKPTGILAGYEFVKKWNNDHVFVDVTYEWAGTWVYDVKILYQYNTGTYARKLIWLFEYNRTTKYYITKTGTNPFAWVPRTIVLNPILSSWVTPTLSSSSTWTVATTPTTPTVTTPSTVTLAEIEKAYGDKRYLSVISLSNSYLSSNPATYDLLRIRYRTYFIIGKYSESLAEIEKINTLGRLDKSVACDAQVIATYGKNTALTNTYTSICKGK